MSAVAHSAEGRLERERRLRPRYAAVAVAAADSQDRTKQRSPARWLFGLAR